MNHLIIFCYYCTCWCSVSHTYPLACVHLCDAQAAAFPEATFVSVGPSASSYDVLMSFLQKAGDSVEKAQSRILLSTIPVMAYQTPLEGETFAATAPVPGASPKTVAAGIAVFTPKGAPAVITGLPSTAARARAAAGSLSEGGMTAMRFKGEAGLQSTMYVYPLLCHPSHPRCIGLIVCLFVCLLASFRYQSLPSLTHIFARFPLSLPHD